MAVALLMIRIVVAGSVALHGIQKFTAKLQGHGVAEMREMCGNLGLRPVKFFAFMAGASELVGGLMVVVGFATPFGAAAVIGMMATAVLVIHLKNGYFTVHGGFEYPFVLGVCTAAIALIGAGRYSVDNAIGWHLAGWKWFAFSVVVGLAGALATWARATASHRAAATATPAAPAA